MAATGHPLTGIATSVGHQVIKTRGNAMAAHALDKLADIADAAKAIKLTDARLEAAAKGLSGSTARKAVTGPYRALPHRYADAVEHVEAMKAEPTPIVDRVMRSPIRSAPKISAAIAAKAANTTAYLFNRLPPSMQRQSMGGPVRQPRQTEPEMQRFVTVYEAVKNPERVLDNLAAGRVKRDEVYALRDTSPELFAELQQRTLDEVARKQAAGHPLTHNQRLKLGIIFDVPTDPSLEPMTMQRLQTALEAGRNNEQKPAAQSPQRTDSQLATNGIDRLESF